MTSLESRDPAAVSSPRIRLTGDFACTVHGTAVRFPHGVKRVVTYLAIAGGPVTRTELAGSLWPDVVDARAFGDLRSALWRLRRHADLVTADLDRVSLSPMSRSTSVTFAHWQIDCEGRPGPAISIASGI